MAVLDRGSSRIRWFDSRVNSTREILSPDSAKRFGTIVDISADQSRDTLWVLAERPTTVTAVRIDGNARRRFVVPKRVRAVERLRGGAFLWVYQESWTDDRGGVSRLPDTLAVVASRDGQPVGAVVRREQLPAELWNLPFSVPFFARALPQAAGFALVFPAVGQALIYDDRAALVGRVRGCMPQVVAAAYQEQLEARGDSVQAWLPLITDVTLDRAGRLHVISNVPDSTQRRHDDVFQLNGVPLFSRYLGTRGRTFRGDVFFLGTPDTLVAVANGGIVFTAAVHDVRGQGK
ncbi:MAG: hypothetical protein K2X99_07825 [Gemmatimonadaceae bacterium]|nr:hypothetical protein [Gemmatimonadaceae bacterium]